MIYYLVICNLERKIMDILNFKIAHVKSTIALIDNTDKKSSVCQFAQTFSNQLKLLPASSVKRKSTLNMLNRFKFD